MFLNPSAHITEFTQFNSNVFFDHVQSEAVPCGISHYMYLDEIDPFLQLHPWSGWNNSD